MFFGLKQRAKLVKSSGIRRFPSPFVAAKGDSLFQIPCSRCHEMKGNMKVNNVGKSRFICYIPLSL